MRAATRPFVLPVLILISATFCTRAGALDRPAPGRQVYTSSNGQFHADVEPGRDGQPGVIRLFEGDASSPAWTAPLAAGAAPGNVLISDDGHHMVALNNGQRPADAVALYVDGSPVAKWSLDRFLLPAEVKSFRPSPDGRGWRSHAVERLVDFDGRRFLAIWLGDVGRWAVLDVATAKWRRAAPPLVAACETSARQWSRGQLDRPGGDRVPAINLLGALRDARDRALLERQLSADDDYRSSMHYFGDALLRCTGRSEVRKAADAALAAWDGRKAAEAQASPATRQLVHADARMQEGRHERRRALPGELARRGADPKMADMLRRANDQALASLEQQVARELEQSPEDRYVLLGVVDVTVRVPEIQGDRAALYVYLLPERVGTVDWAQQRAVYRVTAVFSKAEPWPSTVAVRFEGVTPGRYWVKAVYDCAPPLAARGATAFGADVGDCESTARDVVEARSGQICRAALVDVGAPRPADK